MSPRPQVNHDVNDASPPFNGESIVISGMSGLFPKSHHVKEFSEVLYNKVNGVGVNRRWNYDHPEVSQYTGNIPSLSRFDAQFFKVHFRLGNSMDSMCRKSLEQAYQAIYDSGMSPEHFNGKKVGVYMGSCFSETEKACFYGGSKRTGHGITGCNKSMFANRISYWLNAKGPSLAFDAACCSSIVALEQAYLALSRGECEAAVVGGANVCLHPQSSVHYGRIMKVCMDGKTKSFDQFADGCAKSEAINILFLQKAKNAKRVYAQLLHVKSEFCEVLKGKTGPKYGFYRNPSNYANFLKQFYKDANMSPQMVEYVEAFGSAVPEADKVELDVIEDVFCEGRVDPLLVGSVMSNIGYGEASSGITAITKVLLGYHKGMLAGNLHCDNPRQDIPALQDGRMQLLTDNKSFSRSYTAVNGLSVTGINAHVLLHGRYKPKDLNRYKSAIPHLVVLSGRQDTAVTNIISDMKSRPIDPEEIALFHNIHQTRISGHLGRGYAILATNENNETVSLSEKSTYFDDIKRPLWFVYSGMGSQWAGMGSQLMRIPIFAAAIERCRKVLEPKGVDIVHIITSPDKTIFDNILNSFVGIAAIQIGLTDILKAVGIEPDMIIGHSVGELGCAYADGCFTAEEMILAAYSRGLVSIQTPFIRGSMAAVGLGYKQVSNMVPPEIEVACHNGPDSSTISGPVDSMREFVAKLTAKGIFAKEVPCSNIAYHSRYIAEAGPGLLTYLREVITDPKPRSKRWVSTSVPMDKWEEPVAKTSSAEYHTNNLLNSVLFEETSRLIPANAVLLEIAPHGLLQAILKRSLPDSCKHIPMTKRGHSDNAFLVLDAIGKLHVEGYSVKVDKLYPEVEFPVSSETPLLSHLVEWAHGELWPLPLYQSAHQKLSASANFVITIHDVENKYLQGHVIKGQTLYPSSAILIAVWDTLAMIMEVPKKQLSVQFHDVCLYAQPRLHDQRQLKLSVALLRGTGAFEVLDDNRKVATGVILSMQKSSASDQSLEFESTEDLELTSEDIYNLLSEREYEYSGEFRSIYKANPSLTEAQIVWKNNWVTFLDSLIQLNILRHDYDGISQLCQIRSMSIDVRKHNDLINAVNENDEIILTANVFGRNDCTRCSGVTMHNIELKDLPIVDSDDIKLQTINFVPRFRSNADVASSLRVYLQMVSENINKENINVLGVVNYKEEMTAFNEESHKLNDINGVNVHYEEIQQDKILSKPDLFLTDVDLVIVKNLSSDDSLCQMLYNILPKDIFIINEEEPNEQRKRPTALFRVVSSVNTKQSKLELMRWRPTPASAASTVVTVRTHSDLDLLATTRATIPPKHKIIILSSYPTIPGLKELVQKWRKESNNNELYVVMISEQDNLDQLPELNLAFNVLENGVWGGEYCTPWQETMTVERGVTLRSGHLGDIDSLHWVEAQEPTGPGIPVTVHYAAINDMDTKRATGVIPFRVGETSYGMDFSGITESGERVMGLIPSGSASGRVKAKPELLWPVPDHWSLEDAVTVPTAYVLAFYCLSIKVQFSRGLSILVHGGAGALGQAAISVALANGCNVFATVSDVRKKQFLMRLFPDLKGDHIGNSRDNSFSDMVLNATQAEGCDVIICTLKGELKHITMKCGKRSSVFLDMTLLQHKERFTFGMAFLTEERNYVTIDMRSILKDNETLTEIQEMISEGITRGYVRPLSRVTYAPNEVSRAFRLLAASRHRGRAVLRLNDPLTVTESRLSCSPEYSHLIVCNEESLGLQFADRLIKRGAKKLLLHFNIVPRYFLLKTKSWESLGVTVVTSTEDLSNSAGIIALLGESNRLAPLEGVYVIANNVYGKAVDQLTNVLANLDLASRNLCPSIKYFAVVGSGTAIGQHTCHSRVRDGLPATTLNLAALKTVYQKDAVEAIEQALRSSQPVLLAHSQRRAQSTLLQQIADIAELDIPVNTANNVNLLELGIGLEKVPAVCSFLSDLQGISLTEEAVPSLTIQQIRKLEDTVSGTDFKAVQGLDVYFSYVDSDELLAGTEMVFLPTRTHTATMRDDVFDVNETYLCIVPGMEGHYGRFKVLTDQLKLPVFVLQPGFELVQESLKDTAEKFAKSLLKITVLKENFYLLGYETGILVALEMAAIFEEHGLTGTVFCIGGTPEELHATLEEYLRGLESEEALQDAILRHMFNLMVKNTDGLDKALSTASSWKEKIEVCVRMLLGRVAHSAQYARGLFETAYMRIQEARNYKLEPRKLRSQLILFHASSMSEVPDKTPENLLQQYSQKPVIVHELRAPLLQAAEDLRCPAFINKYLSPELLESFENRSLCESYLLSADTFVFYDENADDL